MKIIFEQNDYDSIVSCISDNMGIVPNQEFIELMLRENKKIASEIIIAGYHDTCFTEYLCDCVSKKLIGEKCPTYGDGKEVYNMFKTKLFSEALKRGFCVITATQS